MLADNKNPTQISVVIPVINELETLPGNIESLLQDPHIDEIIIVDGGSDDGTLEYALEYAANHPRLELLECAPGRGRQMNLGAQRARGKWLIFHHADSILPALAGSTIARLDEEPDTASVAWGGFSHRFSPRNWKLRLISVLHNFRCRQTGVIYGDQSMFARRDFFWRVGGFCETGIEDLLFSDQALECAPSFLSELEVETDSRKFRQMGEFRALAHVACIIWRFERDQKIGNESFFNPYR